MKIPFSGGVVLTSSSFGFSQARESVRNPQKLGEQTKFMCTGPLKKIKKASPRTNQQWHAEIARNPEELDKATAKLNHALANIGEKPFAEPTRKWKHRMAIFANAVFSVPDAGNAKRNRNTVLALSKKRQLPDSRTLGTKMADGAKAVARKAKHLVVDDKTAASREPELQVARRKTMQAFKQAMEAGRLLTNAQLVENEAKALRQDLERAQANVNDAEVQRQALPQGGNVSALEREALQARAVAQQAREHLEECEKNVAIRSKYKDQAKAVWEKSLLEPRSEKSRDQSDGKLSMLADFGIDLDEATSRLNTARTALQKADADLAAAERRCEEARDWDAIRQAGTDRIKAAIEQVNRTISAAGERVKELTRERDYAVTALNAAERREMDALVDDLPGFDTRHADMEPLRAELRKLVLRLDERPIDLTKPRVPSPIALKVAIGTLDQVIEPKREQEPDADAATRRANEAAQILQEFTLKCPPTSSDAHQRWQAAVKSLPGGLRVMEQFGFLPYDEEETVVFARQIAQERPDLAKAADKVARTGRIDLLDGDDRTSYETALAAFVQGRNPENVRQELVTKSTARRVLERAEKSLQEGVPGADRNALIAAKRAAEKILVAGNTGTAAPADIKHYNALRKEQEAVRRTAAYVGAIARNLQSSSDPRVNKELMRRAAEAADHIYDKGHDFGLNESMRACFYAVRNGFLSPTDPNLAFAEERFGKLKDTWVERADLAAAQEKFDRRAMLRKAPPGTENPPAPKVLTRQDVQKVRKTRQALRAEYGDQLRGGMSIPNTLRDKTPFTPGALREASKISTLGYADPARPMQRLDQVVGRVLTHLDQCVSTIPPGSLSVDDAVLLAATLATREKVRADAKRRPGDVELGKDDATRIQQIYEARIRPLVNPLQLYGIDEKVKNGIAELVGGEVQPRMAAAHNLMDLVNDLSGRIPSTLKDGSENVHRHDLMKDSGIATDMIRTKVVSEIHTVVDLYNYLKPMIQQLELRGRVKSSSGGSAGVSTRLLSFPLELVLHLVGNPRGALGGNRVRHAVFEIGFSTTGFEIFIGSEKRSGAFISGGYGFRGEVAEVLGFGPGVDKTLSGDLSTIPGVWLKFPRGDGDEVVRDRALAGLQTLLGVKDENGEVSVVDDDATPVAGTSPTKVSADGSSANSDADSSLTKGAVVEDDTDSDGAPPLIQGKIGKLLANNPNMSVSVVGDYRETNFKNEIAGSANVLSSKLADVKDMPRVTALQLGASTAFRTKRFQLSDATGYMRLTRSNKFNGGLVFGQAVIGGVSESFNTDNPDKTSLTYGSALAQSRQMHERGVDTKYRGISRDGEINAVDTRLDTENVNLKNHLMRIEANRRAWIQCGINELFKDPNDPTPLCDKIRIAEAWLDDHIDAVKAVSDDNARHVFSLSYSLKPAAGAILDGLNADAELHKRLLEAGKGKNSRDAYMQDIATVDEVMLDQSSWREWKITASERTSEKRRTGWTLGIEYTRSHVGEGQRGFNSYPK